MSQCLGCYLPMNAEIGASHYHPTCSRKLFGSAVPPAVDFGLNDLEDLAKKSISQHLGITGVQPKVSLHAEKKEGDPNHRLMIVDLWGDFILKPSTDRFPEMSVMEDATMHMAEAAGLETAKHGLISLKSGELAYVTKCFDRGKKKRKIAIEDFCQLSELLTESKYDTSTEKAGKIILKFSSRPGLDAVTFFDLNIFCFLTGNADMHLKKFSLMTSDPEGVILSPAYDLLSTKLLLPSDKEEMALTVNGKKARLKKKDWIALGENLRIQNKAISNSFARVLKRIPEMKLIMKRSLLSADLKKRYTALLDERAKVLVE